MILDWAAQSVSMLRLDSGSSVCDDDYDEKRLAGSGWMDWNLCLEGQDTVYAWLRLRRSSRRN